MHRKLQKGTVIVIVALLCISLIGTSFVAIFLPEETQESSIEEAIRQEYEQRKQVVEFLSQKVEEDPQDLEAQIALADAYYNKAGVSVQLDVQEYQQDLEMAVDLYQQVLTKQQNTEVLLKLANSAFLAGEAEIAEESYIELLEQEPENVDALYGYGMYLFYDKEDPEQAEANWQKALNLTTDEDYKKVLEEMISKAQGMSVDSAEEEEIEQKEEQEIEQKEEQEKE